MWFNIVSSPASNFRVAKATQMAVSYSHLSAGCEVVLIQGCILAGCPPLFLASSGKAGRNMLLA